jgi:hypothetical protein
MANWAIPITRRPLYSLRLPALLALQSGHEPGGYAQSEKCARDEDCRITHSCSIGGIVLSTCCEDFTNLPPLPRIGAQHTGHTDAARAMASALA